MHLELVQRGRHGFPALAVLLWHGENYYSAPSDSTPYAIGDKGYVRTNPTAGVDIDWVEGGHTASLSYSTLGAAAPDATTKVDEVKALAQQCATRLAGK